MLTSLQVLYASCHIRWNTPLCSRAYTTTIKNINWIIICVISTKLSPFNFLKLKGVGPVTTAGSPFFLKPNIRLIVQILTNTELIRFVRHIQKYSVMILCIVMWYNRTECTDIKKCLAVNESTHFISSLPLRKRITYILNFIRIANL